MRSSFRRMMRLVLCCTLFVACSQTVSVAADPPAESSAAKPTGKSPADVVKDAPKGTLKNPYSPDQEDIVKQGHELFMSYSCSGCHGGTGGGGMCPPLTGDVWFFGIGDDALFRLVTLGSADLQKAGFEHLGGPTGMPMPPFGGILKSDDELWKILTWVRSVYKGDPKKKTW